MPSTNRFHTFTVVDYRTGNKYTYTVPKRYTNLKFISGGSQGTVVSADDVVEKRKVAIKKMHQPFYNTMSAKRAHREFVLLSSIKHPNIIETFSVFTPQETKENFTDVYLVMEFMQMNLHQAIETFRLDHKTLSFFIYQILCAVNHLHREGIIHRDLKPSNIVVDAKCNLKVLDFGLARLISSAGDRMTTYVVTRYYRAPEVVLGLQYSEKADVWSIGCIFAEIINQQVLFPGKNSVNQWFEIIKTLGTPSEEFMAQLPESIQKQVRGLPVEAGHSIEELLPDRNFLAHSECERAHLTASDARRLSSKMLTYDPNERYSVKQALQDPYVRMWFKDEETNAPLSNTRYNWDAAEAESSLTKLNTLIFDEIKQFESNHDVFGGL
ncbi:hypothetical protein PMAYCL1PPCAC_08737 [Pristionchus mayeri]|uniref:Stress-activated protein kinase JNK n=1 Tax=Pristionchus mayeri TaxID=1317129 RepID=A0AAN4ZCA5_9BILA|nr:hypothetical protein PMAYCL1PPCAC_08737 [Pristionchus mayeri]